MIPTITLMPSDALLIIDIQNDFLTGGALSISGSHEILPTLLGYVRRFQTHGLPIFLSRDWHPPDHCSFLSQGGPWPTHCVAGCRYQSVNGLSAAAGVATAAGC